MFARSTVFMNTLPKFVAQSFQWIKPALLQARSISVEFMHAVSATLLSALYHLLRGFEPPSKERSFFPPVDPDVLRAFARATSMPEAARSRGNSQESPTTGVDDQLNSAISSKSSSARSSRSNSVGSNSD
jgi:hypothetical protein